MNAVLVVYHSRTGSTARVAAAIASACDADLEEIREPRSRRGLLGWLRSIAEARGRRTPKILPPSHAADGYALVILGSPVWASRMSSPMRTYLQANRKKLKRVALFVTEGGRGGESAMADMAGLCPSPPEATLEVKAGALKSGAYRRAVSGFVRRLGVDRETS